ncbi:NAD(P)-dependent alcohol dehydrogenase [Paraburkholderia domus]|uniref:Formaldehyde dehydrogenase AdhA n=1 Tax=Paraburkholderia domus TaxID=2793075 RepID=A0A9N8N8C8_9BURK|nr:NAD(P)-dependent alcohol dehydrogenase [Paraburkholderia domus]MBK5053721.1 NAD(P)-dependent alcohol dehydrogenase [Burkholderia sp. R-70006]MBK5065627.1 NAD(P)-dependent alcohol dehydrogenase [Burkholderia sp. R-70199]MBK5169754.1 NAD(P)-dependent alcohol dehydrogenase [Burkholderia sp. R-70211]MBK5186369.1 NAD(P)-dependent alcohol dehydrogenase [Burkholderia sp. R-69749]CAE6843184.1 putative formaldehyde dehydrogenase AdhA [Paraburkholderia domus]
MGITVNARCTCSPRDPFKAYKVERRDLGPRDVLIDIAYAGICHSDIDHAFGTRGKAIFPLVPGHEIAGIVSAVGCDVTKFIVGDRAGVGCIVDSCRVCPDCLAGLEQYCSGKLVMTYNSVDRHGQPTHGGYSEKIVVDEDFVLRIPEAIPLQNAAPLFCAGITLYSPLRHWQAGPGKRVAIVGFGGLGHIGVQIAHALGAHTTVLDLTLAKQEDGLRMGADDYRATTDPATFTELANSFDLIVSTVPGSFDLDAFLSLLRRDGTFVNLGVPQKPLNLAAFSLLNNRRSMAGTLSGGLRETQAMIDFCAKHGIAAQVEIIGADQIDEAYERLLAGDVRYRFVIDVSTM